MDRSLLILLILQIRGNASQEEVCSKTVVTSCGDCIRSGPYCMWCKQLNFTKQGEKEAARCNTWSQLIRKGCTETDIISPENNISIVKHTPLSESYKQEVEPQEPVQLFPQEVNLRLRPGIPTTFTISFKRIEGYPVDLYYLMDLSYSMEDDLRNVRKLGQDLFRTLKKITEHAQIGFGSFVDKTVLPFTNTNKDKLLKPCDEKELYCQPAFGYRHVLSMTANETEFNNKVRDERISGNLDSPEGSLDAMMQAAVCGDKIGWRNSSTRLIVLTTDAGFHMAGDGKLAGILQPNDEQCHVQNNLYSQSSYKDYPSVGQLSMQLERNNIQPIFAVTENMEQVYRKLSKMIPKSEVGVLSSDSKNVVELIESAYNRLSSKVTVTHDDLPEHVKVTYAPICNDGGPIGDKGVCDNVLVGQKISFNVTIMADECIKESSFIISPLAIKDALKVILSTNCECDCGDPPNSNNSHCNGKGQVTCGICSCSHGFVGGKCECSVGENDESSLRASCRRENGSTECEGRGECECGRCSCNKKENGISYHGDYCECDDEQCEKFLNKFCGGNGRCHCGTCNCNPGFEGSACQCTMSEEKCRTPGGSVCTGRGTCQCNECKCKKGYEPPFCDVCNGCPDPCQTKQKCIECLGFGTGPFRKNCTETCANSVKFTMVEQFNHQKKVCKEKDSGGCWMKFKMEQLEGENNYSAQILQTRECPELTRFKVIIGSSFAAVGIIGILIICLIKAFISYINRREYDKFLKEIHDTEWTQAQQSELYQTPNTIVMNPLYTGDDVKKPLFTGDEDEE